MEQENKTTAAIELVQNPIIKHRITEIGKSVTKRIEELNLSKIIVTDDNIQVIKKLRAELNKENSEFESQFKLVETAYMAPLKDVKDLKKEQISDVYKNADDLLKEQISKCELIRKNEKKSAVMAYFEELCQSEKIDFIKFDQLGIEINLSTTEKSYKEKVNEYITKVTDDLLLIRANEFEAEIMVEYKESLNVAQAITKVVNRKEAEKVEAERIKQQAISNRKAALLKLGMVYDEFSKSYFFNQITISISDVESISKEEFTTIFVKAETEIKALIEAERLRKEAQKPVENYEVAYVAEKPIEQPMPEAIHTTIFLAPVVVESEKQLIVEFQVTASRAKLDLLKTFLITNEITYKNI
jgi:hypothetical protein